MKENERDRIKRILGDCWYVKVTEGIAVPVFDITKAIDRIVEVFDEFNRERKNAQDILKSKG